MDRTRNSNGVASLTRHAWFTKTGRRKHGRTRSVGHVSVPASCTCLSLRSCLQRQQPLESTVRRATPSSARTTRASMGAQWKAKHKEAAANAKGRTFGKLSKEIMIAARSGADPDMNPRLRLVVEQAKKAS